jgi:transposase
LTWEEIMLHSGIDLHKNDLVIDTLDASGTAVAHQRLRAERPLVSRYFRTLPKPHRAVVESTASWYWLADLLEEEDVELTLAHSKLVKAIAYAKVKTDAVDAHTLAQLLRVDLVPRAHMISPELRGVRDVLRVRLRLCRSAVAARTRSPPCSVSTTCALWTSCRISPAWRPNATSSRLPF